MLSGLSAAEGLPPASASSSLQHDEDAGDVHIPLLIWWALEVHCGADREKVVDLFRDSSLWNSKIAAETILPRLMKAALPWPAVKGFPGLRPFCFDSRSEKKYSNILLKAFEDSFRGRSSSGLPEELLAEIVKLGGGSGCVRRPSGQGRRHRQKPLELMCRIPKRRSAYARGTDLKFSARSNNLGVWDLCWLSYKSRRRRSGVQKAALGSLQTYQDDKIGTEVVDRLTGMAADVREVAEGLLVSRKAWGRQLLDAVDTGKIAPASISRATVRGLPRYRDEPMAQLIKKHWGDVKGLTTEQMRKDIERLAVVVSSGKGDPYHGKNLFTARCGSCHLLHGAGGTVGPDLTPFQRDDLRDLLLQTVSTPARRKSAKRFETSVVVTESGRILTGIIVEKDARVVVLRTGDGRRVVLPKSDIESIIVDGKRFLADARRTPRWPQRSRWTRFFRLPALGTTAPGKVEVIYSATEEMDSSLANSQNSANSAAKNWHGRRGASIPMRTLLHRGFELP